MTSRTRTRTRKGFTLVEMVVVLIILAMMGSILWQLVNELIYASQSTSHAVNCMLSQDDLVNQIRRDLADAQTMPEAVGDHRSDDHSLLIQHKTRLIRYCRDEDSVTRDVLPAADNNASSGTQRWHLPKTDVLFKVGTLVRKRDRLFIDVTTRLRVRAARTQTRQTHYELILP